jgi:hypothetical protein
MPIEWGVMTKEILLSLCKLYAGNFYTHENSQCQAEMAEMRKLDPRLASLLGATWTADIALHDYCKARLEGK